jgi:hypothetical protein
MTSTMCTWHQRHTGGVEDFLSKPSHRLSQVHSLPR